MKTLIRPIFTFTSIQKSPAHRITISKILQNIQSHHFSNRLINNAKIGLNCTKIALKYSRCYLCRLWFLKYPIRTIYGMSEQDQILDKINKLFLMQFPFPKYSHLFNRFSFENKKIYSALALTQSSTFETKQQSLIIKFLTAVQLVNLGFSLHHSVGKSQKLNLLTRIALKMMSKQMKDSYLVLGGDYFHIKGSVLAAETNNVKLSELLSEIEIDFCKYVHFTEQLKNKVLTQGYDSIQIRDIYKISVLKTSPVVKSLIAVDLITNRNQQNKESSQQIYQIIGLIILYRKELENFMFNFKDIVKKYFQYKENKINFDSSQSLPYFIFFQGAQQNKRIDLCYLNTVTMMSEQIQFLQNKLRSLIGSEKAGELQRKINYYLMIYS